MSYEKNTWATGDTITAAKLNNMEDGIADAGYDLVFRIQPSSSDWVDLDQAASSDVQIVEGSIQEAEEKLLSGLPIRGKFEVICSYGGGGYDTYKIWYMTEFMPAYRELFFIGFYGNSDTESIQIQYDTNYAIVSISFYSYE